MFRLLLTAVLGCWMFGPQAVGSEIPRTVLSHFQQRAETEVRVLAADWELLKQRVDALQQLDAHGHSTFLEYASEAARLQVLAAQRSAAERHLRFISQVSESAQVEARAATKKIWLITIPGLQSDVGLRPFGTMVISDSATIRKTFEPLLETPIPGDSCRLVARRELVRRLSDINDDSPAAITELAIARLKLAREEKSGGLTQGTDPSVTLATSLEPFELNGNRISHDHHLLSMLQDSKMQSDLVAQQQGTAAILTLHQELLHRLETAEHVDANPPYQLATVRFRVEQLSERLTQLNELRQLAVGQSANRISVSLTHAQKLNLFPHLTAPQLSAGTLAALNSLRLADEKLLTTQEQYKTARASVARLQKIVANDDWFSGELRTAQLKLEVAKARQQTAMFDRDQSQRTYEFVTALRLTLEPRDSDSQPDWGRPLVALFRQSGESTAEATLLEKTLVVAQHRLTAMNELRSEGHATWKEAESAKVDRDELVQQIQRHGYQRQIATAIATILQDAINTEKATPVADLTIDN